MRYIKLFEEFKGNRIKVTTDEKKKLREIARVIIKYCSRGKLTSGVSEKYPILFDLGELKKLIGGEFLQNAKNANQQHIDNGYKVLDDYAKKLSKSRGTEIIFDRKNICFITTSGKAMTTVNVVSEYPIEKTDGTAGYQTSENHIVYVNYKTGDIVSKSSEETRSLNYIAILDFSGDNIFMSINQNIRFSEIGVGSSEEELENIFSTLYHEFIHSKDPLTWNTKYLGNDEIYGVKNGGVYASHDTEVQTFSNQFLELIEYYFERTLRGDKDGNGVNYNLTKKEIDDDFIPNILEIVDFIDGKIDEMSNKVLNVLRGNKSLNSILNIERHIVNMRNEDAEEAKVIRQWMRDDFNHFVDYYNTRVIEINKQKEKGQELRLLHKGFPFEITPVKPTPVNVQDVTDAIEETPSKPNSPSSKLPVTPVKPVTKPVQTIKPSGDSKLKFISNTPKLPSWVKNPVVWASDQMEEILNKNLSVLATAYSKCLLDSNSNALVDVKRKLETLLKDLKTNNPVRIKDSVRVFYSNIKLSDTNVSSWLKSPEGIKWGETIVKYENLVSHILK